MSALRTGPSESLECPECGSRDTWDVNDTGLCEDPAGCNACGFVGEVFDLRQHELDDPELDLG